MSSSSRTYTGAAGQQQCSCKVSVWMQAMHAAHAFSLSLPAQMQQGSLTQCLIVGIIAFSDAAHAF